MDLVSGNDVVWQIAVVGFGRILFPVIAAAPVMVVVEDRVSFDQSLEPVRQLTLVQGAAVVEVEHDHRHDDRYRSNRHHHCQIDT